MWQVACKDVLRPEHKFSVHQAMFELCYVDWEDKKIGPRPVWVPDEAQARQVRALEVFASLQREGGETAAMLGPKVDLARARLPELADAYSKLQSFSVQRQDVFWRACFEDMGVR